jgi:hypothetical protein
VRREKIGTDAGMQASIKRRKNPAKFICELCGKGLTRQLNLNSVSPLKRTPF